MRRWTLWIVIALLCGMSACGSSEPQGGGPVEVGSSLERLANTSTPHAQDALRASSAGFAMRLLREATPDDDDTADVVLSPYSVELALAMVYGGARGNTEAELAQALGTASPQVDFHAAINDRAQVIDRAAQDQYTLRVVNQLWGQNQHPFVASYLDTLAQYYGAKLRTLDFISEPEAARETINAWVEDQTEGHISNLLPEGSISDLTVFVLTNAIYLKAAWTTPFVDALTREAPFRTLGGESKQVQMMHDTRRIQHATLDGGVEVITVPMGQQARADLVIIMPPVEGFKAYTAQLDGAGLLKALQAVDAASVRMTELALPRFKVGAGGGQELKLLDPLGVLGVHDLFDEIRADLSGLSDDRAGLHVNAAVHKAYIEVNETGVEASAATGISAVNNTAPVVEDTVTIDRPFLFFVRERQSDAVLFAGRVVQPRE